MTTPFTAEQGILLSSPHIQLAIQQLSDSGLDLKFTPKKPPSKLGRPRTSTPPNIDQKLEKLEANRARLARQVARAAAALATMQARFSRFWQREAVIRSSLGPHYMMSAESRARRALQNANVEQAKVTLAGAEEKLAAVVAEISALTGGAPVLVAADAPVLVAADAPVAVNFETGEGCN